MKNQEEGVVQYKSYKEIQFSAGCSLGKAFYELITAAQDGNLYCGNFNDKMLYSDIDSLDTVYQKVTGKTKIDYENTLKIEDEEIEAEKQKHQTDIPKLTAEWIEKGNAILDKEHHDYWAETVPVRLSDLYEGMELGACLEIIEKLNNGCELSEAKAIIGSQGHSGMSFGLVLSMVKRFCKRGAEFYTYAKN